MHARGIQLHAWLRMNERKLSTACRVHFSSCRPTRTS